MSQVRYQLLGPLIPGDNPHRPTLALALEDGQPPQPVVLVWALPEIAQDADVLARLRKETERAIVFEHPHILRVHALVNLDGRVARVTEYADGEPLRHVLEVSPRLPPLFAALIASDVATGLHYAHVAGNDDGTPFVHGDLRPETIMISAQGLVKVTGYGALGVAPREKNGRRVRNRRLYSAPEQLLGGREASSIPTDVFLLGLLLHECLSGRKPFQDSIDQDKAILSRPLPPLPEDVPLAYNEIIRRATAKRAKERYPSALAFRDALVSIVGELPTHAALAEFLTRQIPHDGETRRNRRAMIERGIAELARGGVPAPAPRPAPTPSPVAVAAPTPIPTAVVIPAPAPLPVAPPAPPPPAPVIAQPVVAQPVVAQPVVAQPVVAQPVVAQPVVAQPIVAQPVVAAVPPPVAAPPAPSVMHPAPGVGVPISVQPAFAAPPVGPPPAAPRSRLVPAAIIATTAAVLFASAVGIVWNIQHEPEYMGPEDAGVQEVSLPAPVLIEEVPDAGPPPPPPTRAPAAPAPAIPLTPVQVFVTPDVLLSVDGRQVGRTPLTAQLAPGRHLFSLVDEARGVRTARTVDVRDTRETVQFNIRLNLGSVLIHAEPGAQVILDGQRLGVAPVAEQPIFEGEHHVRVVNPDKSVQERDFVLPGSPPGERMVLNAKTSDGSEEEDAAEQ